MVCPPMMPHTKLMLFCSISFCSPKEYLIKVIMQYIVDTTRKPVATIPVPDITTEYVL